MKTLYFVLCIAGTALPLAAFLPWVKVHGLNVPLLIVHAFDSPISAFAWADVLISAIVLIVFVFVEGWRLKMRRPWLALLGLTVGVSLAMPLFLLLREHHLHQSSAKP
ncbi:MAG: DUF2834 domain-containing protein [Terrimicrobiaceae bacterium]|nr:DUF2834 domain-containing protein [Terrimicrobiaceae bacterium]